MNNKQFTILLAVAALMFASILGLGGVVAYLALRPATAPAASLFGGNTADAKYYAAVFTAAADAVALDGQQAPPVLTQRAQIDALNGRLGSLATAGRTKYPALPPLVARAFESGFGIQAGPLTANDRAKAVDVLRKLAAECGGAP